MTSKNNRLENGLENKEGKENGNEKNLNIILDNIKESLENLDKVKDESDNLFSIVVEELSKDGIDLPNEKIKDIRFSNINNEDFFIVSFDNSITMMFSNTSKDILTKIKGEQYFIVGNEAEEYRDKYYNYLLKFLEKRKEILKSKSLLAKTRLERLGI
ncbi:MAG: hypothetical protein WCO35_00685 [Candidatus Nomurabacteria bacterium]